MARGGGGRRRTYVRDANGRFASTPGGGLGAARKAARSTSGARGTLAARSSLKASRAKLRAKDPADQRLSTTLSARAQKGAVTRGNKALRAAKAASQRTAVGRSGVGTISQKRSPVMKTTVLGGGKKVPAIDRPGSMANTLRQTMQALAKADAQRIREVESITGQKVRAPRKAPAGEGATVRASGRRSVSGTLGDNLKKLAQSDARMMRGIGEIVRDATPKVGGRKGGKAIGGGKKALPPASSKPPASKPPSRAKGSRTRLPGIGGTIAKPKGLKPGALKGKGKAGKRVPKLQFDSAATSRRLARATARIDKAFDEQNTFMVNKLARARRSYMLIQSATKGDAKQARDIYRKERRYSTVRNPKDSLTPKSKPPGKAAPAQPQKPTASKGRTLSHSEAMARRTEAMFKKGEQTGAKAQDYLRKRGALQAKAGDKLWRAEGRAGRVVWSNRSRLASIRMGRVNAARKERRGGFS